MLAERLQQLLEDGDITEMKLYVTKCNNDDLVTLAKQAGVQEVAVFGSSNKA